MARKRNPLREAESARTQIDRARTTGARRSQLDFRAVRDDERPQFDPGQLNLPTQAERQEMRNRIAALLQQIDALEGDNQDLRRTVEELQAQLENTVPLSEVNALVDRANQLIQDAYVQGQQSVIDYLRNQGIIQ